MTIWSAQIGHVIFSRVWILLSLIVDMAVRYQVKVYYGTDFHKCGTFFTSSAEDFNYYGFIRRVKDITKTFQDISCDQIRVRYLDDENCYVNLEEDLMSELFRCARSVPETSWKRINVQAEVWYSPAPTKKRKKEFETEIQPPMATSEDERQPAATFVGKQSERYTSPVDNLIRSKEEQIRKQEAEIGTKTREIASLEQSFSQRPIDSTRTACTKCHLRAGHTRANCVNECCTSARLCGDIKRHPEEKRQIKDLKTDLQLLKSKVKRLKGERDSLIENMQSSKRTFSQRILTRLINSNKEKYISYLSGREVMNWMAINTDAKKVEKICHGAVPGPGVNLQELVQKHDSQEKLSSLTESGTSSRSNVVKELWAKKGVKFPGTGPVCPPFRYSIPVPQTPEEEDYQINLALRESQLSTFPCGQKNDEFSVSHAQSISRAPDFTDFRFSAETAPYQGRSATYTSTSTGNASEENALSFSPFSHATSISQAGEDSEFTQVRTDVNLPFQGSSASCPSINDASEENALSLLASAANLLSDINSTEY